MVTETMINRFPNDAVYGCKIVKIKEYRQLVTWNVKIQGSSHYSGIWTLNKVGFGKCVGG